MSPLKSLRSLKSAIPGSSKNLRKPLKPLKGNWNLLCFCPLSPRPLRLDSKSKRSKSKKSYKASKAHTLEFSAALILAFIALQASGSAAYSGLSRSAEAIAFSLWIGVLLLFYSFSKALAKREELDDFARSVAEWDFGGRQEKKSVDVATYKKPLEVGNSPIFVFKAVGLRPFAFYIKKEFYKNFWIFCAMQVLYFALLLADAQAGYSTARGVASGVGFVAASFFAYLAIVTAKVALSMLPRPRGLGENNILIGVEYPHPVKERGKTAYVGRLGLYYLNPLEQKNPHVVVLGASGSGKTTTLNAFLVRNYLANKIPFILISSSNSELNELNGVAKWRVPFDLKLNPFTIGGMSKERKAEGISNFLKSAVDLTPIQAARVKRALIQIYSKNALEKSRKNASIAELKQKLIEMMKTEKSEDAKESIRYTLDKLQQVESVIGEEPNGFWRGATENCTVIDTSALTQPEKRFVTNLVFQKVIEAFQSGSYKKGPARKGLEMYIAIDDAYTQLRDIEKSDSNIMQVVREGRKYGFGVAVATQLFEDVPKSIIGNSSIKVLHGQELESDAKGAFGVNEYEAKLLKEMKRGYGLIYKDAAGAGPSEKGPAFVKIIPISEHELHELAKEAKAGKRDEEMYKESGHAENSYKNFFSGRLPDVSVYLFLVAMFRNNNDPKKAVDWLRSKKVAKMSKTLVYGDSFRLSVTEKGIEEGYIDSSLRLTQKALEIVDPERMVGAQKMNAGGEMHKELMKKIIEIEQERGNFAFVPSERESFDVGVVEAVNGKWWRGGIQRAYEVQTNALPENIKRCIERRRAFGYYLIFVAPNNKIKEKIKEITKGKYKVIVLKY